MASVASTGRASIRRPPAVLANQRTPTGGEKGPEQFAYHSSHPSFLRSGDAVAGHGEEVERTGTYPEAWPSETARSSQRVDPTTRDKEVKHGVLVGKRGGLRRRVRGRGSSISRTTRRVLSAHDVLAGARLEPISNASSGRPRWFRRLRVAGIVVAASRRPKGRVLSPDGSRTRTNSRILSCVAPPSVTESDRASALANGLGHPASALASSACRRVCPRSRLTIAFSGPAALSSPLASRS